MDEFGKFWDEGNLVNQISNHRFFNEILSGTLGQDVFVRYLKLEFDFVKTAARSYGAAIRQTDNLDYIRELSRAMYGLTHEQFLFFGHAGLNDADVVQKQTPASGLKGSFQLLISNGSFLELLVAFFAAENLYSTWCARPIKAASLSVNEEQWIEMHRTTAFLAHRAWLGNTIMSELKTESLREGELKTLYRKILLAEADFHEIPYSSMK